MSDDRLDRALARMDASRAAMRHVLVPQPPAPPSAENLRGDGWRQRFAQGWSEWRGKLGEHPGVSVAMDAAQDWWQRQPLRPVVGEIHGVVKPWVRRNPLIAVSVVAVLAAGIAWARPWRMPAVRARMDHAPQRVGRWLWHQLTQAPVQSLIASLFLGAVAARKATNTTAPAAPPKGEPPPAPPPTVNPSTAAAAEPQPASMS